MLVWDRHPEPTAKREINEVKIRLKKAWNENVADSAYQRNVVTIEQDLIQFCNSFALCRDFTARRSAESWAHDLL